MKPVDLVLIPKAIAEKLYREADAACNLLADMQPAPKSNAGKTLVKLANAVKRYEKEKTW